MFGDPVCSGLHEIRGCRYANCSLPCRDPRGEGSSDDGPGGSAIASELSLGEGVGRARPSRTQSTGTRLKSAPATPAFSALLHAVARDGPAQGPEQKMPRVGSFPGAGKRVLEAADLEQGPQQKRARTILLPEMIHDSQHMSYRPSAPGMLLHWPEDMSAPSIVVRAPVQSFLMVLDWYTSDNVLCDLEVPFKYYQSMCIHKSHSAMVSQGQHCSPHRLYGQVICVVKSIMLGLLKMIHKAVLLRSER